MHLGTIIAWQNAEKTHYMVEIESINKAHVDADGNVSICINARFGSELFPVFVPLQFYSERTIQVDVLRKAIKSDRQRDYFLDEAATIDIPIENQKVGCSLEKSDSDVLLSPYEAKQLGPPINWVEHAKLSAQEWRNIRAKKNQRATILWIPDYPIIVFVDRDPLRKISVTSFVDHSPSYSEITEYYTVAYLEGWEFPKALWRHLYGIPIGIIVDIIFGPSEWVLYSP